MTAQDSVGVLLDDTNILSDFSESELKKIGIKGEVLHGLKVDPFQGHMGKDYLAALVLNYLARNGSWNSDQAANSYVLAIPFSEHIGYDLADLLDLQDGERPLVVEKSIAGEDDLYIAISDLHFFTDKGQGENLTTLAAKYYQTKSPTIRDRLLLKAQEKVINMAIKRKAMLPPHIDIDDLISAGMQGLWKAVESYDPSLGTLFETHLSGRVKGAMIDEQREQDPLPRLDRINLKKMEEFREEYIAEHHCKPIREDYKAYWLELELPDNSFNHFYYDILLRGKTARLDQLVFDEDNGGDKDTEFGRNDIVADPKTSQPFYGLTNEELKQVVEQDLKAIPEKYRPAFRAYFYEEATMKIAVDSVDLSESRFSQLCIQYLQSPVFFKRTRAYLGFREEITLKL